MRTLFQWLLSALMLLGLTVPASAQTGGGGDPLQQRGEDVVRLLKGEAEPASVFTSDFLAQVPPAQISAITAQLVAAHGAVQRLEQVDRESPNLGTIHVGFERSMVRMRMGIEPQAPHKVAQLLVTGQDPRGGDSIERIIGELRALPGQVSFQIARLGDEAPASVAAHEPDRALAIGSSFKLIILAELGRQIEAGQHRWNEVVPIDRHSLPSGILQDWPLGSPVTVHTLASLMISRSDNTATDILLRLAGRENVERMMTRMGMSQAARNRPFLSTIELFHIKADTPEARAQWAIADEAARRRLLRERYGEGSTAPDLSRLYTSGPTAIDTVEWFASAADMAKVMDWLRRHGDETVKAIMAISPGLSADAARDFAYVGFKGGSEPGVINLTYLVRNQAGAWFAVSGGWNNPAAAVEEARFASLMGRALRLVK